MQFIPFFCVTFLILTMTMTLATAAHLRGGTVEFEYVDEETLSREMKERILRKESEDEVNEYGVYDAGSVNQYNNGQLNSLLRNHEKVGFIKKWRGADRLVLTSVCTITGSKTAGAYYCVDNKTVCVTMSSVKRFYGQHMYGGKCGTLPLSDEELIALPYDLKKAYFNTCGEDNKCDGHR